MNALDLTYPPGSGLSEVTSVTHDSRAVVRGSLFAAVQGFASDGRRFVSQAVEAGAVAVMTDAALDCDPGVPVLRVSDVRSAMALAAATVYGHPSRRMTLVGITGTNGKTTTTYLIESMLNLAGRPPGVLGTVSLRFAGRSFPASMTTPEAPDLQRTMKEMLDQGVEHLVMEVSSHALDLSRVAGCEFDVAVFTNLSRDHLDYHRDLEAYFEAKRRLFFEHLTGGRLPDGPKAVVNVDDEYGRRLARDLGRRAVTFSLRGPADLSADHIRSDRSGLQACFRTPRGDVEIRSRLLGGLNLYNFLAAAGVGLVLDLDAESIARGLEAPSVPGRLERVGENDGFLVLVDYAHTEDALSRVLEAVRALGPRRLITIFGCGGDRDRGKRPRMGKVAGGLSDLAIVTSDNPRTEYPLSIIDQVEAGMISPRAVRLDPERLNGDFRSGSYVVLPDRREAIGLACRVMAEGDILVIAGKGHEDYQILGHEKIHFDDREEAALALRREGKF